MPDDAGMTTRTLLRLDDVSVRRDSLPVVDDVSLIIDAGAPTVLMGPNGAGKTTLLKVMMGLIAPTSGTVARSLERVSFVFQKPAMLRRSVADNVAFALKHGGRNDDRETVERTLDLVGLSSLANRHARKLSGGEQQRLALARALVRDPEVLFLDEPTASLDPAQTKAVEDIVRHAAARGVKVVMSTHDIGEAKRLAGDVVILVKGRLVEHTPAAMFFKLPRTETARRFLAGDLVL